MIVPDNPVSEQHFFHDLITVYSVLEREADVVVVTTSELGLTQFDSP